MPHKATSCTFFRLFLGKAALGTSFGKLFGSTFMLGLALNLHGSPSFPSRMAEDLCPLARSDLGTNVISPSQFKVPCMMPGTCWHVALQDSYYRTKPSSNLDCYPTFVRYYIYIYIYINNYYYINKQINKYKYKYIYIYIYIYIL